MKNADIFSEIEKEGDTLALSINLSPIPQSRSPTGNYNKKSMDINKNKETPARKRSTARTTMKERDELKVVQDQGKKMTKKSTRTPTKKSPTKKIATKASRSGVRRSSRTPTEKIVASTSSPSVRRSARSPIEKIVTSTSSSSVRRSARLSMD